MAGAAPLPQPIAKMKRNFSLIQDQHFDLLVIGGGIYGAWTAYDAALRGLKVALVEQNDWASATSSASSKLIHGGLRYLETYDFRLVKKALRERQMLLEAAPYRVWPLRFGVPVYDDSRVGTVQLMAGLTLYDLLAGELNSEMSYRHFDAAAFAERFPWLSEEKLHGGFTYADAQTDDARLVLELVDGAMQVGAVCVNYCRVAEVLEENGTVCGALLENRLDDTTAKISARQIVSTAGQWTRATEQGRAWCRLTKGVHLVLPALPGDEAVLLTAKSDGRVFFIIPWYGLTLVGTTDTDYEGDINRIAVEDGDVDYLLDAANHYLKTAWKKSDIIGSYAGVRVMKRDDEASPSSASRDWELKTSDNGLHYSVGGKITSAREDAAKIVNAVCARLGIETPCPTRGKRFPWHPDGSYPDWLPAVTAQARLHGVDKDSTKWLIRRHGRHVTEIFRLIENDNTLAERILPALPFIRADILWCARNEMVVHLHDLLRRRMPLLILARLTETELRQLAEMVAPAMGWDEAAITREIASCRA